jgi:hypothetical protein
MGAVATIRNNITLDIGTAALAQNASSRDDFIPEFDFTAQDLRFTGWDVNLVPFADATTSTGNTAGGSNVGYLANVSLQILENNQPMFNSDIRLQALCGSGRSQNVFFGKPLTFDKTKKYTFVTKNYGALALQGGQYCFFGDRTS